MADEAPQDSGSPEKGKIKKKPRRSHGKDGFNPVDNLRAAMLKRKIEGLILQGISSGPDLALACKCSGPTALKYREMVIKEWEDGQLSQELSAKRAIRVHQLDHIGTLALKAFAASQQSAKETITQTRKCEECYGYGVVQKGAHIPKDVQAKILERDSGHCVLCDSEDQVVIDTIIPRSRGGSTDFSNLRVLCMDCYRIKSTKLEIEKCGDCDGDGVYEVRPGTFSKCLTCEGTGIKPDIPLCPLCQGSGEIVISTTKEKGQAGDSAFLSVAQTAFREAAKLDGVLLESPTKKRTLITQATITGDGKLIKATQKLYEEEELPEDVVLAGLSVIDRIKEHHTKAKNIKEGRGRGRENGKRTIDVVGVPMLPEPENEPPAEPEE